MFSETAGGRLTCGGGLNRTLSAQTWPEVNPFRIAVLKTNNSSPANRFDSDEVLLCDNDPIHFYLSNKGTLDPSQNPSRFYLVRHVFLKNPW